MRLLLLVQTHWLACTLVLLAVISLASLSPLDALPPAPGSDKLHHLVAYAILVFPLALRKPSGWLLMVLALVLYSGAIELVQPYVNRHGEWMDMAANSAGLGCGCIMARGMHRFFNQT